MAAGQQGMQACCVALVQCAHLDIWPFLKDGAPQRSSQLVELLLNITVGDSKPASQRPHRISPDQRVLSLISSSTSSYIACCLHSPCCSKLPSSHGYAPPHLSAAATCAAAGFGAGGGCLRAAACGIWVGLPPIQHVFQILCPLYVFPHLHPNLQQGM